MYKFFIYQYPEQLKVGQDFRISFDVRSRNPSGTLFYVVGKEDFLKITIENVKDDGSIKVTCNNGGGLFSVAYKPEPSISSLQAHCKYHRCKRKVPVCKRRRTTLHRCCT